MNIPGMFQKRVEQRKYALFRNLECGIFHKKTATEKSKILDMEYSMNITKKLKQLEDAKLEYGIFHGIFLEYSKKSITTRGGVKFNQAFRCVA